MIFLISRSGLDLTSRTLVGQKTPNLVADRSHPAMVIGKQTIGANMPFFVWMEDATGKVLSANRLPVAHDIRRDS